MEMIEVIKLDYERWKKADGDWVDAMLALAKDLADARRTHKSNNELGAWLERNGVKIHHNDRAALIYLVGFSRENILSVQSRSPRLIYRSLQKRFTNDGKSDSAKSKKPAKKHTRDSEFAPKLLAAIRRKRKEANDVRINSKWRPQAVNTIMLHDLLNAVEQFLDDFINHRKMSLDVIEAVKRDPRAAERKVDYVTQDECRVGEFDA